MLAKICTDLEAHICKFFKPLELFMLSGSTCLLILLNFYVAKIKKVSHYFCNNSKIGAMTFSIMTFRITTLSINDIQHNDPRIIVLSAVMLSVVMPSVAII